MASNRSDRNYNQYNGYRRESDEGFDELEIDFPDEELPEEPEEEAEPELTEEEMYLLRRKQRREKQEEQRKRARRKDMIFVAAALVLLTLISFGIYKISSSALQRKKTEAAAPEKTGAAAETETKEVQAAEELTEQQTQAASGDASAEEESTGISAEETAAETPAEENTAAETSADPAAQVTDAATVGPKSRDPADSTDENGNWVPPYPTNITVPSWITPDYIDVNEKTRPGRALTSVDNIVVHYVGNPGTSAKANRDYFNDIPLHDDERGASSHFVVGFEGEVIQCVPLGEMAFANYPMNDYTISIETCHPDETGQFTETTYRALVRLVSWLCEVYGLTADDVIRHYDVTGKLCPIYYCPNNADNPYGHPEEWDHFRNEIRYYMNMFPDISATDP